MSSPSRSPAFLPFPETDCRFEARVFYVRVSNCNLEKAPEILTMLFPPHDIAISVELNGARIPPSEEFSLTLRRNQVDIAVNDFVIYVSTDSIRTSSTIQFLVKDRDTLFVSGTLKKLQPVQEVPNPLGSREDLSGLPRTCKMDWIMESASEVDWQGCAFVKARQDSLKKSVHFNSQSPAMEVCVSGTLMGTPAILSNTVQLTVRRRPANRQTLNAIPEDDEIAKSPGTNFLMDDHMKKVRCLYLLEDIFVAAGRPVQQGQRCYKDKRKRYFTGWTFTTYQMSARELVCVSVSKRGRVCEPSMDIWTTIAWERDCVSLNPNLKGSERVSSVCVCVSLICSKCFTPTKYKGVSLICSAKTILAY